LGKVLINLKFVKMGINFLLLIIERPKRMPGFSTNEYVMNEIIVRIIATVRKHNKYLIVYGADKV
jgi:hypothetical protein